MLNCLQFKPLTAADLPAVLELDRLCFGGLWTLQGYERELASDRSHFLLLAGDLVPDLPTIADESCDLSVKSEKSPIETKLVGLACFWAIVEEAHITLLAIHPQYRRQGLGKLLLYGLLKKARDEGLERATLEVRASNQDAISLYEKFGFKLAGKRLRYYQDNNEDALILWQGGLQYPEFAKILSDWEMAIAPLVK